MSQLATSKNMPPGLKITDANNQTLYYSTLFAKVDTTNNKDNKDNNNKKTQVN
jgi:hypothetical protein